MDLDDDLRRLFADDRLAVPARPGAEDVIVAGARRVRRRRIAAVTASGAFAAVVVVTAGVLLAVGHHDAMPPANRYEHPPARTTSTASSTSTTSSTRVPAPSVPRGSLGATERAPSPHEEDHLGTTTSTGTPPPVLDLPVLGPGGFAALGLGQPQEEAAATGMVGVPTAEMYGSCSEYQLLVDTVHVGWVYFSSSGVAAIMPFEARTPEGVGPGWTVEQAATAYPDLDATAALAARHAVVAVPGNPDATFRLLVETGADRITRVALQTAAQPCFP